MNHIYFGLSLSLICLFLAYLILPTFLLVTVICVILAGLYFKDDFILFRYIATHVASFYLWICDFSIGIQNMYHQSNNTNFPIRKSVENNGGISRKFDRLHHGSSYNLSTSYVMDNKPINSGIWDSGSNFSSPSNSFSNRTQSTLHEMSKLNIGHHVRGENSISDRHHSKAYSSTHPSPHTMTSPVGYSRKPDLSRSGSSPFTVSKDTSSNVENKPPVNARLYADVSSPGFCGRVADRLHEESMTHQSKYDAVGAFPVVNLRNQSSKIKIKTPVRVRLAPPSSDLVHYSYGANTLNRSSVMGPDDQMKSVLQVLKEISRKRIHSHIDDDSEENSKRLRVTDSPFESDGLLHASLLQQTIQGKRAREESSPNEDDKKRRKASLKNNEILSSLSSSISIQPPHLQTAKRKAQSIDDSITSTPVLGKLLKVQTEVTPPAPTNHIAAPDATCSTSASTARETSKTRPPSAIPSPIAPPPAAVQPAPAKASVTETPSRGEEAQAQEDGAVSRLLGRMSDQTTRSVPLHIPVKKNVFMSTNDLSLSPPKENRLAAMIAVLGGPSEQSELESSQPEASSQPERLIKGKALFMTPETPATPDTLKQNKKVTFSDSLTTTKIFERDEPDSTSSVANTLAPLSTPLSSFSSSANTTPTGPKTNFGAANTIGAKPFALNFESSPLPSSIASPKPVESSGFAMAAPTSNASSISSPSLNFGSAASSSTVSGATASSPSTKLMNTPSSGGFSFGSNISSINAVKDSSPNQNTVSSTVQPISFGGESKTSQSGTPVSSFPSLFSTATPGKESPKGTNSGNAPEQNKPMLNIFGNKDNLNSLTKSGGENKPLVNGFTPTSSNSSPFSLSQAITSKTPSFANTNTATTSQSASPFGFGSTPAFSTNSIASFTTQQSTSSECTSTSQQSSLLNTTSFQPNIQVNAASPSLSIFNSSNANSVQSKPGAFGSGMQATPAFGDNIFKPVASSGQTSQASSVFGSTPSQSSGFGSSPALQNGTVASASGSTQSNMFGNMATTANKPLTFGSEGSTTQSSTTPVFGFSGTPASTQASSPFGSLNNSTSNSVAVFGSTPNAQPSNTNTMFGNTTAKPSSTPSMFGNSTTAQATNNPSMFGNAITTQPANSQTMFGNSVTAQLTSAPTMFGTSATAQPSNTPTMFGNSVTSQPQSVFGSGAPSSGSQTNAFPTSITSAGQPPLFGGAPNNDASKNMFAGTSNSTPTFRGQSNSAFGNQSNSTAPFGSQNTTAASTFGNGNQSGPAFTFGSQNVSNPSGGFGGSGVFSGGSSITSTKEVKPPAFGSGSTFTFGSAAASKPAEAVKPLGTATPFAFNANAQQGMATNLTQPSVPSFGAQTPTFGASQQAPTFAGGSSQQAAPTFQFGQTSAPSAAPAFQFNAGPPTVGGGMFSIGSGGSTTSRPKTTALRRNKRT